MGRLVALAVAGGIAALILFVVSALVLVGQSQRPTVLGFGAAGDSRMHDQAQQACVIFNRWVPTAGYNGHINKTSPGDLRLLRRAITYVGQSRRLRPNSVQRLNLQTYLTVLLHRVQENTNPNDFVAMAYEQSIGNDCSLIGYGPG